MFHSIKTNGKSYKRIAKCYICSKKFVVDTDSELYDSKYDANHFCKKCYKARKIAEKSA